MQIKLVASDLDGTFLANDNSIPESNLRALETINQKQIPFAICTGKSYAISKDICNICNAQYGIFGNGTQIVDLKANKEIYSHYLSFDDIMVCYEIAVNNNLHIHAYGDDFILTENLKYLDLYNYIIYFCEQGSVFGKYDEKFNLTLTNSKKEGFTFYVVKNFIEYLKTNNLSIFNIVLSSENSLDNVENELSTKTELSILHVSKKRAYKDTIINKEYEYLSIAPKKIGKGTALNILKDYLKVDTSHVLSIGDNLNDIDLLKNSGVSVAIANAYEPVKAVAKFTTQNSASNGGFAEAVYRFVS